MKEMVVLSGKGGTGKTSMVGAFAHLAQDKVLVDCDVDASDLHLLLDPRVRERHDFHSGIKARVEEDKCSGCGLCQEICQFEAIELEAMASISPWGCEGCGVCAHFCPEQAIVLDSNHCGSWSISDTNYGSLVHAELFAGEENSGKLVAHIKEQARQLAASQNSSLILIDGAPGVACPVIASLNKVDLALVVTEPSQSGSHDLTRLLDLADHFHIPALVCINKWDLHPEMSEEIGALCSRREVELLGRIPFDPMVITCQIEGLPVTSSDTSLAAYSIRELWRKVEERL